MKIKSLIKLAKGFIDKRGKIIPICDQMMRSASLITTKKNHWRANHYHKSDWHYCYVIYGKFEYYFRKTGSKKKPKKLVVKKNELLFTGPKIDHAMLYTEKTAILVLSKNPRDQKTYEADTVRIDFMNNKNKF